MTQTHRSLLLALCATSALGIACATPTHATLASRAIIASERSRPDSVVVRVVNKADRPVAVYRTGKGTRASLGRVKAGGEGRFALRAADVSGKTMTLSAAPVGTRLGVESKPFRVARGEVAVFTITPQLGGSQVYVDRPSR
jgi:hypothetical protein